MSHSYIVTTLSKDGRILKSDVWKTSAPYGLGFPYQWTFEKIQKGFRIRNLKSLSVQEVTEDSVCKSPLQLDTADLQIKIHRVGETILKAPLYAKPDILSYETKDFKRLPQRVMGGLIAGLLLLLILPKPKTDPEVLIPPQFAKVILAPASAPSRERNESKAKPVNVVQTLQSNAVKKSASSLLRASMASLLAKSTPFSLSKSHAALGSLFDSSKLRADALDAGKPQQLGTLKVNGFGGSGSGTNAVGYGNGERAVVQGQGNVYVALNTLESTVDEGLSKDEVGRVIHSHISEVRYCYESAMVKNPDVQGKLIVNFVIRPVNGEPGQGTVKTAQVNSSTLGDETLDHCIISRLTRWKFPKPRGGVEVAVAYPFIFKSLGK